MRIAGLIRIAVLFVVFAFVGCPSPDATPSRNYNEIVIDTYDPVTPSNTIASKSSTMQLWSSDGKTMLRYVNRVEHLTPELMS